MPLTIAAEPADRRAALALLRHSDAFSAALYPPEHRHQLDAIALRAADARFFVARLDGHAVGCGALVLGAAAAGEVKRMFVEPSARGRGVGGAVLETIEAAARDAGVRTLRLETGDRNAAALRLYRDRGYRPCGAFAGYVEDGVSLFLEKRLDRGSSA